MNPLLILVVALWAIGILLVVWANYKYSKREDEHCNCDGVGGCSCGKVCDEKNS